MSKSPASSLANASRAGDSDEEYLYNVAAQAPLLYSPDFIRRRNSSSFRQPEQKAVTYTNFTPFGSPSTIRKSPTCPTRSITPLAESSPSEESSSVFSPLTLTQSRCDNRMRAARTSTGMTAHLYLLNISYFPLISSSAPKTQNHEIA